MRFRHLLVLALIGCGFAYAQVEGLEARSVEIEGTVVEYLYIVPDGFTPGGTYPVLLLLPPGHSAGMATTELDVRWHDASARGWVVASPLAPIDPVLRLEVISFRGSEALIPPLLDHLADEVTFEGGRAHLAGVASSGGKAALRIATLFPERFRSLLVLAGWAEDVDFERISVLAETPVRLYVGENDVEHLEPITTTYEAMVEAGVGVDLVVVDGDGHRLPSLGGAELFDWLDAQRP